jgi:hypothetical protein
MNRSTRWMMVFSRPNLAVGPGTQRDEMLGRRLVPCNTPFTKLRGPRGLCMEWGASWRGCRTLPAYLLSSHGQTSCRALENPYSCLRLLAAPFAGHLPATQYLNSEFRIQNSNGRKLSYMVRSALSIPHDGVTRPSCAGLGPRVDGGRCTAFRRDRQPDRGARRSCDRRTGAAQTRCGGSARARGNAPMGQQRHGY